MSRPLPRTLTKGMSMPSMLSNGLSISQWDSSYISRIAVPLTSKLCLTTESSMAGGPTTKVVAGRTKVLVGSSGRLRLMELRLQKIESQTAKDKTHDPT